jgi:hypothetical protein
MTPTRIRRPARLAMIGSIAVVATSVLAMPAASGAGAAQWITVSSGNINNTGTTPSIAKFGETYEAIWVAKTGATFAIEARILNAAGKPLGAVIPVVTHWEGIQGDPTILAAGKLRLIAFSGDREGKPSNYDNGAEYYSSSTNGRSWTLSTGSLSDADGADNDNGTAVVNNAGAIITALATGGHIVVHNGASTSNPATGPEIVSANTGNGTQEPGLAVDAKTHQVWATWFSDSSGTDEGIHAQALLPSVGSRLNAPGSTSKTLGTFGAQQDVTATARTDGGVYTAYGTPNVHAIDVWKLGAKKPFATIKDSTGVASIVLTAAPLGRLWLFWRDSAGWRAARSNKAATRFGPVTTFAAAKNLQSESRIAANGGTGPLEVVAVVTNNSGSTSLIARQILPRLSVSVSPSAVKRGHSFTVRVTDAADAVKGTSVHVDGQSKKTSASGRATFTVAGSTSVGKHTITLTLAGYAAASTTVTVKA